MSTGSTRWYCQPGHDWDVSSSMMSRRMMSRASLFAIAVMFLYGSPAHALTRVAPPGNSGVSEYQENVPSAGGGVPVTNLPATGAPSQALPHSVVTQLDHAGAAGRATAQLADRTAPRVVRHVRGSHTTTPPGRSGSGASINEPSAASVGSQLSDSVIGGRGGGLGLLLPVVLAGSLTVAAAVVLARRRRTR